MFLLLQLQPVPIDVLGILTQVAFTLVLGIVMFAIAKKTKFPFVVLLILAGTLFVSTGFLNVKSLGTLPEVIRVLALIIIVFSAGFRLNLGAVKRESRDILNLATVGVLISAIIIMAVTFYLLSIPLLTAAFLGALLSGTDPAAIISVLKKKAGRVQTLLASEAIFNAPLTVILPLLLLDYFTKPELAWMGIPTFFALIIVGGTVGVLGALGGQWLLKYSKREHQEVMGLMVAIAVYVVAENFFGSGILAVAVASILITAKDIPKKEWLGEFNSELAFIFTIFVFVLLGMQFSIQELIALSITRFEVIAILVALLVARLFAVMLIMYKSDFSFRDRIRMGLIAPKGVAAAALAPLLIISAVPDALTVVKITYIAIILSILISIVVFQMTADDKETMKEKVGEKSADRKQKILSEGAVP